MNLENLNLDIRTGVITATVLFIFFAILSAWGGYRAIQAARKIRFYRLRQQGMVRGWRLVFSAFFLIILAFATNTYAEPVAYRVFPPTTTPTLTPTITLTPTVTITPSTTLTPTITETPSVTNTPTPTSTPSIPLAVEALFESTLAPNPNSIFSEFTFTQGIDENYVALSASTVFTNPVGHMYALFSYDQLLADVQWTALWYREGELVHSETFPWDGGTGGRGYTDWNPSPDAWLPGEYTIYMYLYLELFQTGSFTVVGDAPTPEPTLTPSITPSPTITPTPAITPSPTSTTTLTHTPGPSPTKTPYQSPTPTKTNTPWPTPLPSATLTPKPTYPPTISPTPTITRWPTGTPMTPSPTITKWPSPTNTTFP